MALPGAMQGTVCTSDHVQTGPQRQLLPIHNTNNNSRKDYVDQSEQNLPGVSPLVGSEVPLNAGMYSLGSLKETWYLEVKFDC